METSQILYNSPDQRLKPKAPLILSVILFGLVTASLAILSIQKNGWHWIYPLDDTYIHMAMAKNLVRHGVFGIDAYGFSSSSSSPVWTLLIAFFYSLAGERTVIPLLLNGILGTLVIMVSYGILNRHLGHPWSVFALLFGLIFCSPLVALVFTGMEHVFHGLITIALAYWGAVVISGESQQKETAALKVLLGLAPLAVSVRYEGLFLVGILCLLLILRGRFFFSLLFGLLSIIPIAVYGIISISQDWLFFPNSILIKGAPLLSFSSLSDLSAFLLYWPNAIEGNRTLWGLVLTAFFIFLSNHKAGERWNIHQVLLILFLSVTLIHWKVARTGNFYRYESYLFFLGLIAVGLSLQGLVNRIPLSGIRDVFRQRPFRVLGVLVWAAMVIFMLGYRGAKSNARFIQATRNIYEQQIQMGTFLQKYYSGQWVAANDIGAINYLASIHILDLVGLADMEIARMKLNGTLTPLSIDRLAREKGVRIALVYDHWFDAYGGLPRQWVKVGQWEIADNVVCGGSVVSFYAVRRSEEDRLIQNLRDFSPCLPAGVGQAGKYMETAKGFSRDGPLEE